MTKCNIKTIFFGLVTYCKFLKAGFYLWRLEKNVLAYWYIKETWNCETKICKFVAAIYFVDI